MAYTNYLLKGIVSISGYEKETKTVVYSMAVLNNKSGQLLWKATDLKWKTISVGRNLLNGINQASRKVAIKEMNLPRSVAMRVEIANMAAATKIIPMETKRLTTKAVKIEKMELSDTDKKYAVICKNGVWTIEKFDVPQLVTKEEALEILLDKICK